MQSQKPAGIQRSGHIVMALCAAAAFFLQPFNAASQPEQNNGISISVQPERVEQGSVVMISLVYPEAAGTSCSWNSRTFPLFTDASGRAFGFVPIDMDHAPGAQRLSVSVKNAEGITAAREVSFEIIAKKFPEQHITLDESKVTLSANDLERHNRERAQVEAMFAASQPRRLWSDAFLQPVQGRISTPFGVRRFINKQPRNPHSGIDIAAPAGTPVRAASAGIVCLTGEHFFAGKSVYIDHGHAMFSMYFHLDTIDVQNGQSVTQGEIIGRVGSTGRSTGPHLHWGMRLYDTPVDPLSLLALFE
ncbi:MAG: M23 family metallopeptidase [Deltaproteobacteria bacterium]|nr:M23 family metallopeptidase [Deltaproteobacteria bacterium]